MACYRESLNSTFNASVPLFFINDLIFANCATAAFRDIVGGRAFNFDPNQDLVPGDFIAAGNNRSSQADGYYAQQGFDLCTGWGSPNGVELLNQLVLWLNSRAKG